MPYAPFAVDRFGGLDLINDPQEIGPSTAVDMLNADLNSRGRLRTRDGYAKFTSSAGSNPYSNLFGYPGTSANTLLAVIKDDRTHALDSNGIVTATDSTHTFLSPYQVTCALVGTPGTGAANELVRAYMSEGAGTVLKWDGSSFTVPTATVNGTAASAFPLGCVYLYPRSNRLVSTCFSSGSHNQGPAGGASSQSYLYFSNAGDPETWETDGTAGRARNFIQLTPGDGQRIVACAAFANEFYVFKETRFFVFYGEGTLTDGTPRFDYRTVDVGVGMSGYSATLRASAGICVGSDGVYFLNDKGVWRTNGGPPVRISRPLDPFFDGTSTTVNIKQSTLRENALCWHNERLWLTTRTSGSSTNDRILVYDPALDAWMLHAIPANGLVSYRTTATTAPELFFSYGTGTNDIGQHGPTRTTDAGTTISWSHKSGLYSPSGDASRVSITQESKLVGTGTATLKVATYDASSGSTSGVLDTGSAVTLGTAPVPAEGWQQIDREGSWFQHEISGSGVASVNRLVHYVRTLKPAGVA